MRYGQRFTDVTEFSDSTLAQIECDVAKGHVSVIQFSQPIYTPYILARIDDIAHQYGESIQVRFYGHYKKVFDARILKSLTNVRHLAVDSLTQIENADVISELPELETLVFGIYEFNAPDFLNTLPLTRLKRLTLMENKKRNLDLRSLESAMNLQELFIEGHSKNIETLSQLKNLSQLVLRSCNAKVSLAFIKRMERLTTLQLILGGRVDLADLESQTLETLEIVQVKGLEKLDGLHKFSSLSALRIEDQPLLQSVDVTALSLRRLTITNCKNLSNVIGLNEQNKLEELFVARTALQVETMFEEPWPQSLRCLGLFGKNAKWNTTMTELSKQRGYSVYGSGWI
jgi:hypothetical protein